MAIMEKHSPTFYTRGGAKSTLTPIVRLTLLFMIAQFILTGYNFFYLLDNPTIRSFLYVQIPSSGYVILGILYFFTAQIALYSLYIFILWAITRLIAALFRMGNQQAAFWGTVFWALATISLFIANQIYFPLSQFSFLNTMLANVAPMAVAPQNQHLALMALGGALGIVVLLALLSLVLQIAKRPFMIILIILAIGGGGYFYYYKYLPSLKNLPPATSKQTKPNIIIIGIDSLRPDYVSAINKSSSKLTPNLDTLLEKATVFTRAVTPLARTFPAWMSILTGDYPKTNGARNNLIAPQFLNQDTPTLGTLLQKAGYETIYATDETRFSNIDQSFGFDKIISPKMGFNDFFLGAINDFPLTNFASNTLLGKWLFPYTYANRGAFPSYLPATFNRYLKRQLNTTHNKPMFLAVHFTLAHWPFAWAQSAGIAKTSDNSQKIMQLYQQSVTAVDQQVGDFISILQRNNLLNSTMLVVLSDHGTGFGIAPDRITTADNFSKDANSGPAPARFTLQNQSQGHGTDVLSLSQYHVLLAFRLYGSASNQISRPSTPVSLIDIAPTLLNYLKQPAPKMDGISLLNTILKPNTSLPNRNFFIETDFTVPGLTVATPNIEGILEDSLNYYQIACQTGRLIVNPSLEPRIIAGKQKAVLNYPWLYAVYPDDPNTSTGVLVNLTNHKWTSNLSSSLAQQAPLVDLQNSLKQFYGNELHTITNAKGK